MAEICVRVHDKVNDDFYLNTRCTKRFDVIEVLPDGSNWGNDPLSLPFYRIVKLPNISVVEASALLAAEVDIDPLSPSRTLQRRAFRLDLANITIPQAVRNFVADDSRAQPTITFNIGVTAFRALKVSKASIADPAVIGSPSNVIG